MMEINSRVLPGAVIEVAVAGEIDIANVHEFQTALAHALGRQGGTGVVVDFAGVAFCDSTGIAALDQAYALAGQHRLPFRLRNVQPGVARVLEIVGLLDALTAGSPSAPPAHDDDQL